LIKTYDLIIKKGCVSLKETETYAYEETVFDHPRKVDTMMRKVFFLEQSADEYVYLLALNTKGKGIGVFEVAHGIGDASLIDTRGVFMRALHIGANSIILVHNHPSGDVFPSREDKRTCERMRQAGSLLHIPVTDFLIVADGYFSFRQENLLDEKPLMVSET
jgi:DNA repair protein RadC